MRMRGSRKVTVTASILLLVSLASSVLLLQRLDQLRSHATLEDVLYITSPKWIKRLSLGYDGLMADIYWTRAVQYFGGHHSQGIEEFKLLDPLLDITTALDPKLTAAYEFGANFLAPKPPNGAGQPEKAVALVEYGIRNNPDNWRLYYNLGFIYYFDLKDYARAAEAFDRGSKAPNAHAFLRILAAQMAQHAGEIQMARMLWQTTYDSTEDALIRKNAVAHLRALKADEDVTELEKIVARYQELTGSLPPNFNALIASAMLRGVPLDPGGKPYKLLPDGRIELRSPEDFPFVEKGLPPGYVAPRPKLN
ncbi:MAG: tetratricopeptide repeat protein [Terriglobales bacterium]